MANKKTSITVHFADGTSKEIPADNFVLITFTPTGEDEETLAPTYYQSPGSLAWLPIEALNIIGGQLMVAGPYDP